MRTTNISSVGAVKPSMIREFLPAVNARVQSFSKQEVVLYDGEPHIPACFNGTFRGSIVGRVDANLHTNLQTYELTRAGWMRTYSGIEPGETPCSQDMSQPCNSQDMTQLGLHSDYCNDELSAVIQYHAGAFLYVLPKSTTPNPKQEVKRAQHSGG